jgi:hypothetical protein
MKPIDEFELELAHKLERRLERDDERERVAMRLLRRKRRPRYPRFETLARITDAIAAVHGARQITPTAEREAA